MVAPVLRRSRRRESGRLAAAAVAYAAMGWPVALGAYPRGNARGAGRILFFVATRGTPYDEDEWWSCHLDCAPEDVGEVVSLRWHCRNSYVLAPPSRDGAGPAGRWLRAPGEQSGPLPDAVRLLEV